MSKTFELSGTGLSVDVGRFAGQAGGSAWLKHGNNIVLSVATAAKDEKDFMGFFPLTVEYREKTSAAGRIPGGYIKREGRLSDVEVLTCRIVDRCVRPFFPSSYFNEVQIMASVYSADGHYPRGVMAILSSSIALSVSDIPFDGPVGAVFVSRGEDGKWAFNVDSEAELASDVHILVAGKRDGICMVEGNCELLSEDEMVDLFFSAHEEIKKQIEWQDEIVKACGKEKVIPAKAFDWDGVNDKVAAWVKENNVTEAMFAPTKQEGIVALKEKKTAFKEAFAELAEAEGIGSSLMSYFFSNALKDQASGTVLEKGKRFDGRDMDTVRPISCETGLLPQAHGSATFRRGQTEALASLTLGTGQDAQKHEHLIDGQQERSFMLHYNFPPYSVGEVRPVRSVGRREIGHGYLAENSFAKVIPTQEDFPYTIRSVVDILECNGSSSMATVCATTLAMMDAGVPLSEMVAGVAMGLIQGSDDKFHVLTDVLGSEDALGLMDFKVTGSDKGIRAIQMDIKAKSGLPREVMQTALARAKVAREHILSEMKKTIDAPRTEVSQFAPKVTTVQIPVDKIGTVIGPSGKVIKEIIAQTDTQIDITDDGMVKIYAKDGNAALRAEQWVRVLVGDIPQGSQFNGIIRRFAEFGMFIELVPGKDGLLHVSAIARDKQKQLEQLYKLGDVLQVTVVSSDAETGRVKLHAPELA